MSQSHLNEIDSLQLEPLDDVLVMRFTHHSILDMEAMVAMEHAFCNVVQRSSYARFAICFEGNAVITSNMIGVLITVYHAAQRRGAKIAIGDLNSMNQQVFRLAHLDRLMPVFESADEAVAHLRDLA